MSQDLESMNLTELQEAAETAGISTDGDRDDLITRLQQHAVSQLSTNEVEPVASTDEQSKGRRGRPRGTVAADAPMDSSHTTNNQALQNKVYTAEEVQKIVASQVAEATKKLITPSQSEVNKLLQSHSGYSEKEVAETMDYIQRRFAGVISVSIDKHQEVFQFEGGRQGRLTTTIKQPSQSVVKVAEQYANVARAGVSWDMAIGKVGE